MTELPRKGRPVYFAFGYPLPLTYCVAAIAISVVLNIVLALRYPPSHRLSNREARPRTHIFSPPPSILD